MSSTVQDQVCTCMCAFVWVDNSRNLKFETIQTALTDTHLKATVRVLVSPEFKFPVF